MNKRLIFIAIISFAIFTTSCTLWNNKTAPTSQEIKVDTATTSNFQHYDYKVMFYNCENLFDTKNDSTKLDDEFTPEGKKHWTWSKYQRKINNIAKVIIAVGGYNPPDLVGLCEVENRYVLEGLTKYTPLNKAGYRLST